LFLDVFEASHAEEFLTVARVHVEDRHDVVALVWCISTPSRSNETAAKFGIEDTLERFGVCDAVYVERNVERPLVVMNPHKVRW
jgi:hypothetical protein